MYALIIHSTLLIPYPLVPKYKCNTMHANRTYNDYSIHKFSMPIISVAELVNFHNRTSENNRNV